MNKVNAVNLILVLAVIGIVGGVASLKAQRQVAPNKPIVAGESQSYATNSTGQLTVASLPRLIELGGEKCIPCMQMAPILDVVKKEFEGRVEVEKIDLEKNPFAQKIYAIRIIPTQVFLKGDGQEFWRNEGTLTKEEIVAKFVEMGVK
jgi:thioredoxin 1